MGGAAHKLYPSPTKFHNHLAIEIFICLEQPGFISMILHRVNNSIIISRSLSIENVDCKVFLSVSQLSEGWFLPGMLVQKLMRTMAPSLITVISKSVSLASPWYATLCSLEFCPQNLMIICFPKSPWQAHLQHVLWPLLNYQNQQQPWLWMLHLCAQSSHLGLFASMSLHVVILLQNRKYIMATFRNFS